jgi:plastocyanin
VPAPAPASAPAPARVEIAAFAFGPSPVRINVGQTVTWTNTDAVTHSIQDTSAVATPASPGLAQGDSFSIVYSKAGTFSYICGIHPSMEGSVEVAR